jgi:hypothetical protein
MMTRREAYIVFAIAAAWIAVLLPAVNQMQYSHDSSSPFKFLEPLQESFVVFFTLTQSLAIVTCSTILSLFRVIRTALFAVAVWLRNSPVSQKQFRYTSSWMSFVSVFIALASSVCLLPVMYEDRLLPKHSGVSQTYPSSYLNHLVCIVASASAAPFGEYCHATACPRYRSLGLIAIVIAWGNVIACSLHVCFARV